MDPAACVDWIGRYAAALGLPQPSEAEMDALLALAADAAHASHRQAAPVACSLAGVKAGSVPEEALESARTLGG